MNNYLVTGGLGFIGSHLVEHLLRKDNTRVWIIDDGSNPAWNPRKGRIDYDVQVRDLLVQLMGGYEVDSDIRNPRLVLLAVILPTLMFLLELGLVIFGVFFIWLLVLL